MTREEAIKSALKFLVLKQKEQGSWGYADNDNINKVSWNEVLEWIDKQPCGDCISRQAALGLKTIAPIAPVMNGEDVHYEEVIFVHDLEKLPSVEPERKPGKWIVYEDCEGKTRTCTCNLCGYETGEYTWENPNYCENCGAKMEVDG